MVSHADAAISRVAGGVDHRGGDLLRVDAAGGPQCSVAAPVSVVLRIDHVLERHGTHADNDSGHTVEAVPVVRPAPGFYSSPFLLIGSVWLIMQLRASRAIRPNNQV